MKNLKKEFIKLEPQNRLYGLSKPIIGLTGGIATGKSSAAQILRNKGFDVIDADLLVKKIYAQDDTIRFIKDLCPEVIESEKIHFKKLRQLFFSDSQIKEKIEKFIYKKLPEVFLLESKKIRSMDFIFYDVPLLFEKDLKKYFDLVILIYAPKSLQISRMVTRDQCSLDVARDILSHQLDIEEKKTKSNFVISNTEDLQTLERELSLVLEKVISKDK